MNDNSRNVMRQSVISSIAEAPDNLMPREESIEVRDT